jgi:regulator of sigma E protease
MPAGGLSFDPTAVAAFILLVGILIFVHELGHFLAAKYFNIKVLKFSLGVGPPIFRFTRGETTYQIALLPLGGFVKMLGDTPTDEIPVEDRHRAFTTVPVYQRAIVAFAGPLFNLVFPILCFFAYFLLGPSVDAPIVGQVEIGTPAEQAGFKSGDRIIEIEGRRVWDFDQISDFVGDRAGEATKVRVQRGDTQADLEVVPKQVQGRDLFGAPASRGMIGVSSIQLSTHVGVDNPKAKGLGFETGDRILKIGDTRVDYLSEVERVLRQNAGKVVPIIIVRSTPEAAGDLLLMRRSKALTIEVAIPEGADGVAALGLAPADAFVRYLEPEGPAARAGIRPGDRIVSVAGERTSFFYSFVAALERAGKDSVEVAVSRDGVLKKVTLHKDEKEILNPITGLMQAYYDTGLGLGTLPRSPHTLSWISGGRSIRETAELTLGEALWASVIQTGKVIGGTTVALYKLFTGDISVKTVGGPILLFQVAAQAADLGIFAYLEHLALISVNLGIINLLPVPILDGGHLLFCAIEAIKRRPVSLRVRELATIVGLVLLAMLIVLVFSNDIGRLSGNLFK